MHGGGERGHRASFWAAVGALATVGALVVSAVGLFVVGDVEVTINAPETTTGSAGDMPDGGGGAIDVPPPATCVAGASSPDRESEPNNLTAEASGPLLDRRGFEGEVATANDVDYLALCLGQTAELSFTIDCLGSGPRADCSDLYAEFTPSEGESGEYFDPDRGAACTVTTLGRYFVRVVANSYPVEYRVAVETDPGGALADTVPERAPPGGQDPC